MSLGYYYLFFISFFFTTVTTAVCIAALQQCKTVKTDIQMQAESPNTTFPREDDYTSQVPYPNVTLERQFSDEHLSRNPSDCRRVV